MTTTEIWTIIAIAAVVSIIWFLATVKFLRSRSKTPAKSKWQMAREEILDLRLKEDQLKEAWLRADNDITRHRIEFQLAQIEVEICNVEKRYFR